MSIEKSSIDQLPLSIVEYLNNTPKDYFCTYLWFKNFVENVIKVNKNEHFFVYDAERPYLIWPLMCVSENSVRKIRSLANYYSPIYSVFLGEANNERVDISDFIAYINERCRPWDTLELRPLAAEEKDSLIGYFKASGMWVSSFFCFGNWYVEINGRTFNEYFSGLSSQLRNTVKRKGKKFFQLEGSRIDILSSEDGLQDAIKAYEQVYNASWKVKEPYPDFMPGLIRVAAESRVLRMGVAYLNGRAIAAQVWIVNDGVAAIFKLAYDEDFKHYSAGTLLTTKLMEYVIDVDKVSIIDYLSGDDPYKKDWMSSRRERWGLIVFNRHSIRGCFEYFKERLLFLFKKLT